LILSGGVSSQQNALTSVNLSDLQQQTPSSSSAATKRFPSYNPRAYLTKSTTLQNLKAPGASGSGTNNSAAIRSGGENSNNPGGVSGMGKSTSTRETTTARGASGSSTNGDVIITADLNGSIKVYANPAAFTRTGSSVFFQPKF
jgi:hypothetical protein